ncbi:MAG: hypothetical protein IJ317_02985, partial [Clostridia bacterium]|nr:hypothetical protein [Clostridia bacterium]
LATWVMGGTIENVYVHVNGLNYAESKWRATAGLAHNLDANTILRNCIVEVEDDGTVQAVYDKAKGQLGASYGAFIGARLPDEETMANNWSGVYVISKHPLKASYANVTGEDGTTLREQTVFDAENANANADGTTAVVKRYETVDAFMADATNTYAGFDTAVWKVGNIPAWKNLSMERYARATVDGEIADEITVAMTDANASYSVGVNVLGDTIDDVTLSMSGTGIALDGNTFTVLHAGTAEITVTYTLGGEEYSLTLTVGVIAETETYGQTVEFSAMHGELPLTDIFGENVNLVAAYQGDALLQISADKKRVLGVQTLDEDGNIEKNATVQTQITVYSASKGYIVNLNAYAGILTKAEDLNVFNLDNTDYVAIGEQSKAADQAPTKVVDGYYVLGNDIDASNWAMPTQGYISTTYQSTTMPKVGFQGTFDGQGYTISNLTLGTDQSESIDDTVRNSTYWKNNNYSLFGIIGKNATVKNVAITNVRFDLYNGTTSPSMANCTTLAMWICAGATVENVYVSIEGVTRGGNATYSSLSAVAYGVFSGATLNNIVVDYTYSGSDVVTFTKSSSFVGRKCASEDTTEITSWANVYVVSTYAVNSVVAWKDTEHTKDYALLYASNDTREVLEECDRVAGLYQYASVSAWKQATDNDYTSFDGTYWDMTTGVPVWKN